MEAADKPHAIVVPFPSFGHFTPTIIVALNLASRPDAFSVTYLLPHPVHGTDDLFAHAQESGLDIKCATVPCGLPADLGDGWHEKFSAILDEVIGNMMKRTTTTTAVPQYFLVSDSMLTCTADIAKKYGMVNVSLWISSATAFCLNYHLDLLMESGVDDDPVDFIPGIRSIARKDLPSFVQDPNAVPFLIDLMRMAFEQVKKSDIILCNTVDELESQPLVALNQSQPIYAIGPLFPFDDISKNIIEKLSMRSQSDCIRWLDSKPPASVLYIAFGSLVEFSKHEIREIAHGLLLSKVNFLWAFRADDGDDDIFPVGFEEDVKGRGIVVPWSDQRAVLSNPSVGGFLTHCGWISVSESIWNGVPMICYPNMYEQHSNRKVVVNDWKVGIELGKLTREEIVSKIDLLMQGMTIGNELKEETKKVQKIIRHSLEEDGSSSKNFDRFLEQLKIGLGTATSTN